MEGETGKAEMEALNAQAEAEARKDAADQQAREKEAREKEAREKAAREAEDKARAAAAEAAKSAAAEAAKKKADEVVLALRVVQHIEQRRGAAVVCTGLQRAQTIAGEGCSIFGCTSHFLRC